jgi:Right handed beta helix region
VNALLAVALVLVAAGSAAGGSARVIDVPGDEPTIAAAVAAASPGDTVLIEAGTYRPSLKIPAAKHDVTIRGADRNAVVFDGRGSMRDAIDVEADRVTIENVSAHSYLSNVFYWDDVSGFTARYLTVWNVQGYGIYAEHSTGGLVEQDFVSGAADAAYYIGECNPCNSVIRNVVARLSAVGYSGTNASGNLSIRDSRWEKNGAAILPNSYANEEQPPQERATIAGNIVTRSGTVPVPLHTPLAAFWGIGIGIAGGHANRVTGNTVTGSARYGIALFPTEYWLPLDPRPKPPGKHLPWRAVDNVVTGNRVSGGRLADLALAGGRHNCFAGNAAATVAPTGLHGCRDSGDPRVAADLTAPLRTMLERAYSRFPPPSFESMPKPPPQATLPR